MLEFVTQLKERIVEAGFAACASDMAIVKEVNRSCFLSSAV
jgi:hypothetical protein